MGERLELQGQEREVILGLCTLGVTDIDVVSGPRMVKDCCHASQIVSGPKQQGRHATEF